MKQALATAQAPAAIGPYSQGIAAGQTVYVSGQLPIDPATGAIPEGIAAQTAQSLKNIQAILAEQGAEEEHGADAGQVAVEDLGEDVYKRQIRQSAPRWLKSAERIEGLIVVILFYSPLFFREFL